MTDKNPTNARVKALRNLGFLTALIIAGPQVAQLFRESFAPLLPLLVTAIFFLAFGSWMWRRWFRR